MLRSQNVQPGQGGPGRLESARDGLVLDVREPVDSGAALQELVQKQEPNQYWVTEEAPDQPGYFWLVSADQGLVLDIETPVSSGSLLQPPVQKHEPNQYWKCL
jgi:Ricin-type beta-trefoil lectin domain-like